MTKWRIAFTEHNLETEQSSVPIAGLYMCKNGSQHMVNHTCLYLITGIQYKPRSWMVKIGLNYMA